MGLTRLLSLLLLCSLLFSGHSFQNLTVRGGLSDDQCTSIAEDGYGFIWVGTNEGLNRYDGYLPKIYRSNPFDTTALSGNRIFGTYTDNNGELWVSTEKSIDKYNLGRDEFRRHKTGTSPTFVAEDTLGKLWVATLSSGLFELDKTTGEMKKHTFNPLDPTSISSNQFSHDQNTSIIIDKNNNIWVGTTNGLNFFNRKTETFKRFYSKKDDIGSISSNKINTLHFDGSSLWVGTPGGLDRLDIEAGTIERQSGNMWTSMLNLYGVNQIVPFKKGVPMDGFWMATMGGLVYYDKNMSTFQDVVYPDIFGRYVSKIYPNPNGDLWIYVPQSEGIIHFKTTNFYLMYGFFDSQQDFAKIQSSDKGLKSIGSNKINEILFDLKGTPWFATDKGVSRLIENSDVFNLKWPIKNANSIAIARNNAVWFSHDNGLTSVDNQGKETNFVSDPTDINSLLTNETGKILITKRGDVWAASKYGGVTVLGLLENNFTRYENINLSANSIVPEKINTIYEDAKGTIWLSSTRGVSKFKNGKFSSQYYKPALNNDHLSNINAFLYDKSGVLWVGTNNNGLYTLDYEDLSIKKHYTLNQEDKFSFSSSTVLCIYEDNKDDVWIGTGGEGLFRYDKKSNGFRRHSIDNGLPSNTIASLIEDKQNVFWMGTRNGVSRLDPVSNRFQNYNLSDGLKDRVFFNQSIDIDNYGNLYIGSPQGIHSADPNKITPNPTPPRLALVKTTGIDEKNNRESLSFSNGNIDVDHHVQTIEIEYVGLSFTKSEKNSYRYTLENHLDGWVDNGTSRTVSFQGLKPGKYKFVFMASNNDGVWSEPSTGTEIIVHPPAWKTWWAYSGYVGFFALTAFGTVRRRDKIQLARLDEGRRALELEEAREFQMKMLPKNCPKVMDLEIAAGIKTATEVGGDYYDFFPQRDNSIYVVVGDATGHGMTAGMMVSITKAGLYGTPPNMPPNEVSYGLNRTIKAIDLGINKMAISIARFWDDRVEFTSAAMPPLYHYKSNTGDVDEILLEGLPLGSFKGETYSLLEISTEPEDAFVFISDGLPEATNISENMLGYRAVLDCVRENGKNSAEEIKQSLFDLGAAWLDGVPNQDDITVVVVKKAKAS
jgi:ligand-binding sensor domain-containing protein